MIVKCEKCQTRFKIPDEKVTEKGVKVRCTRCQNTFRVTKSGGAPPPPPPPAPPPPPSVDPDPFAKFGQASPPPPLEATRPHLFPEGIAATRPLTPSFSAQADLPPEAFDSPTRVGSVPKEVMEALEAAARSSAAAAPGGFDPSNPFDSAPPPEPPAPPFPPPAEAAPSAPAEPPPSGGSPADELFGETNAAVGPQPLSAAEPPPAPPPEPPASAASTDESFGDVQPPSGSPQPSPAFGDVPPPDGSEPDHGLFDMPEPRTGSGGNAAPVGLLDDVPTATAPAATPLARIALTSAPVEKPAGRPEDVGMAETRGPGAVRRTAGLVVNLALATALVLILLSVGTIYLNEGKVDVTALSLEPVKALFAAPSAYVAADVSNGLYDTRGVKPVFYVRGDVENHGTHASRLKVRVDIVDGATSIAHAETLAGKAPSPEELYAVTSEKELAALVASLDEAAVEVKPGDRVPFVVAFYEYPPELTEYRLKVTVEEAPGATAAR
ncbi:MAG: zinc-ribbon domain-containing protein [Myxococcaceae bacterium]|nr:zinc-ribbon domain-containing protein [Myxococcaceae bacterium]